MSVLPSPRIYTSADPAPFLPQQSIFDYLFPDAPGVSPLPAFDPALPAFIDGKTGETLSRADVKSIALRLAAGLRGSELGGDGEGLGLKCADTACIWGFNSLEWALTAYGCMAAGVTISPANAAYEPEELAHQINNSGATTAFLSPDHVAPFDKTRPLLKRSFPASRIILMCKPEKRPAHLAQYKTIWEVLHSKEGTAQRLDGPAAQQTAWLCYSSGTTGLPKGVMSSHANITAQLQGNNVSFTRFYPKEDVVLCFLPFSHIYAAVIAVMLPISMGAPVVVLPRFEEIPVLECVVKYKVTTLLLVPPVVLILTNSANLNKYDTSTVKTVMCGAAPLSTELLKAFLERVPTAVVVQGFGMTETSPNIVTFKREIAKGHEGSVGRLMPTYNARLVNEDGSDAPEGGPGELWVRGPSVMKGYHDNVQATRDTIAPGGWMKTGDVVTISDDGWFHVVDRKKELIKYKGFQVAPAELEGLLIQHPKVLDAGVVGVWAESQATELPRAYIVPEPSGGLSHGDFAAEVHQWVSKKVARHKHLHGGIVVVEVVPKSPSGKILRKNLRIRAKEDADVVHNMAGAKL